MTATARARPGGVSCILARILLANRQRCTEPLCGSLLTSHCVSFCACSACDGSYPRILAARSRRFSDSYWRPLVPAWRSTAWCRPVAHCVRSCRCVTLCAPPNNRSLVRPWSMPCRVRIAQPVRTPCAPSRDHNVPLEGTRSFMRPRATRTQCAPVACTPPPARRRARATHICIKKRSDRPQNQLLGRASTVDEPAHVDV